MTVPKPRAKPGGRPPAPANKRRRTNKPASYGLAEPVVAGTAGQQPELAFPPTSWSPICGRRWPTRWRASSTGRRLAARADGTLVRQR